MMMMMNEYFTKAEHFTINKNVCILPVVKLFTAKL